MLNPPASPRIPDAKRARLSKQAVDRPCFKDPFIMRRAAPAGSDETTQNEQDGSRDQIQVPSTRGSTVPQPAGRSSVKGIVDKLTAVETWIKELEADFQAQLKAVQADLKTDNDIVEGDVKELQDDIAEANRQNKKLQLTVEALQLEVEELREQGGGGGGHAGQSMGAGDVSEDDVDDEANRKRDNPLAATTRWSFLGLMKLTTSKIMPDPVIENGVPVFWVGEGKYRVLRPQWEMTWEENEVTWVPEVAQKIQSSGAGWDPTAKQEELCRIPLAVIRNAIKATFQTWSDKYKKAADDEAKQLAKSQFHRRHARKAAKCARREKYRHTVPELAGSDNDYVFTAAYASTEESAPETNPATTATMVTTVPAIDPATEEEDATPAPVRKVVLLKRKKRNQKKLTARPPTYRVRELEGSLTKLDTNVAEGESRDLSIRGEPQEKGLPKICKAKKGKPAEIRILRSKVDPEWLLTNTEYDKPSFFAPKKIVAPGKGKAVDKGKGREEEEEEEEEEEGIEDLYV